jgi:hypothetical protein
MIGLAVLPVAYFFATFAISGSATALSGLHEYVLYHRLLGHSIVSQHFTEPEGSIPNSQELSACSYPEPYQSSPHHPIPPLQAQS